jgi:hypothetical protein
MRNLRKTDIESMKRELNPLLENEKRKVVGGWGFGILPDDCGFYFVDNDGNRYVYLREVVITAGSSGGSSNGGSSWDGSWGNLYAPWGEDVSDIPTASGYITGSVTINSIDSLTGSSSAGCSVCNAFYNQPGYFDYMLSNPILGSFSTYFNEIVHALGVGGHEH